MSITWDEKAAAALVRAIEGLASYSEPGAERLANGVREAMERLDMFPEHGRIAPEFGYGQVREVFVGRYRLLYRLHADGIEVATLWPAAIPLDVDLAGRPGA